MKELHAKMEKAEGKVEAVCELCSGAKAEAFCRQCTAFICDDCMTSHQKMKTLFSGHQVVTLEELKAGGSRIPLKEAPPMLCQDHDEQLKIFCFDCSRLICQHCVIYGHSDHKHEHVKTSAPQCRKVLAEGLLSLKKATSDMGEATKAIEANEVAISAQCASLSNTVQQAFSRIIEFLMQRKQQLLKEVFQLKGEKLKALTVQKEELRIAQSEVQSVVEFVERSLENSTNEELVSIHKQVLTRVEEGCKKCAQVNLEATTGPDLAVDVSYGDSIPLNVGRVYVATADPSKCTAEGAGIESAEVDKPAAFTIHVYDACKQTCTKQKLETEIKSLVDSSLVRTKVIEEANGVYATTYTPNIRGRHTLSIRVNGKEIAGSPFQVFVRIHPTQLGNPVRVISDVNEAFGIAFNSKRQQLLIRDVEKRCVTITDKCGKTVQTIAHDEVKRPCGIALDKDENLYVTDTTFGSQTGSLLKFSTDGKLLKVVKGLNHPRFVKFIDERVLVSEFSSSTVQILDKELENIGSIGHEGHKNGEFHGSDDIAQAGNYLYVADHGNNRIQVFDLEGHFVRTFRKKDTSSKTVEQPTGLFFHACSDFLYVTEWKKDCVSVFRPSGEFVTSFGTIRAPAGITIDDDGFIYVCSYSEGRIVVF